MKRTLTLCCLTLCLGLTARAQSTTPAPAEPPGLFVVKSTWAKERPGGPPPSFDGTMMSTQDVARRVRDERSGTAARQRIRVQEQPARPRTPASALYAYRLTLKNHGAKAIREIDWDYIFLSAANGEELGRHQFTSAEKVRPGRQKELTIYTPDPPTQKVGVGQLGKSEREGLTGRIQIVRVLYDDGSVWRREP